MSQKFAIPAFWGDPTDPTNAKRNNYPLLTSPQLPAGSIIVLNLDPYQDTDPQNRPDPTGTSFDGWRNQVQTYQNLGYVVLGYVDTDSGKSAVCQDMNGTPLPIPGRVAKPRRSLADIKSFIDYWYQVFSLPANTIPSFLDGIFFDDGPEIGESPGTGGSNRTIPRCIKDFYSSLYQYVQKDPTDPTATRLRPVRQGRPAVGGNTGPAVLLNVSQYEEDPGGDWIMVVSEQACDVALLWETPVCKYFVTQSSTPTNPTNVWPVPTPSWWLNPSYAPDRIAHTLFDCHNMYDMQQVIALSNHRGPNGGREAGYVFVIDSNDATYDHLPPYWTDELTAVGSPPNVAPTLPIDRSVATSSFYVRDWTNSPTIYDTGQEGLTNIVFWVTSDVWNRLHNDPQGGGFNTNDQPQSEDPQVDPQGHNTNFAFARIHRLSCTADTVENVTATFLWADYGAGSMFQYVSTTPSVMVTFNQGASEIITPGVQWTLPPNTTNHICMAVEIVAPKDPLHSGDELNGQTSGSATNTIVVNDNNVAQRNLSVMRVAASSTTNPFAEYAIAHNADLFPRNMVFSYGMLEGVQEVLQDAFVEVIDVQGKRMSKPFKSRDTITLEDMQPGENRWIGLTAQVQGGSEGQLLPVTFYELVENKVINGFTIAIQPSPLNIVMLTNLNLHAWEFRRIAAAFEIDDAVDESEDALELFSKNKITSQQYAHFLQAHILMMSRIIYEVGWSQKANDTFSLRAALKQLRAAITSGNADSIVSRHSLVLRNLCAFLTMLQKEQGDAADILQTVKWQRELYNTLPLLKGVKGSHHLVKESEAFIHAYEIGQTSNDTYPSLIRNVLHTFHQTAEAFEEAWTSEALEQDIATMERHIESLTGLQKGHHAYLLKLQRLGRKE